MKVTEAERKRRSKVARELAIAAQHLRHYQRSVRSIFVAFWA
ncbi:MAG: hypothetical protein ACLP3C_29270 [Mycobacterium sp.]